MMVVKLFMDQTAILMLMFFTDVFKLKGGYVESSTVLHNLESKIGET
jgi:hypothetical protein